MAYSPALRSRDRGGGPPAAWGVALRLLLVVGLVSLVSLLLTGGRVPFLPWFVLPVFFFSLSSAPAATGGTVTPTGGRTRAVTSRPS